MPKNWTLKPRYKDNFVSIVKSVANISTCAYRRVGAIIIKDNRIIAEGFNGSPSHIDHCVDVDRVVRLILIRLAKHIRTLYTSTDPEAVLVSCDTLVNWIDEIVNRLVELAYESSRHNYVYQIINRVDMERVKEHLKTKLVDLLCHSYQQEPIKCKTLYETLLTLITDKQSRKAFNYIHALHLELHAETNAIATAAKYGIALDNCQMLVTHKPCLDCMRLIKASGIKRVYYLSDYTSPIYDRTDYEDLLNLSVYQLTTK